MTSHYRHRRSANPAVVFSTLEPGEIAVNTANRQLIVGSAAGGSPGSPLQLIGVRIFDATALYAVGDHVINVGVLYRCKAAVTTPGAFNVAQWELYAGEAPARAYIDNQDAAIINAFQAADSAPHMRISTRLSRKYASRTNNGVRAATPNRTTAPGRERRGAITLRRPGFPRRAGRKGRPGGTRGPG